jgi:hypothetical protein
LRSRPKALYRSLDGNIVRDANGQALAYVYSRQDPTEAHQAKTLTADEGRRIAANIARLPELLGKGREQQGGLPIGAQ